MDIKSFIILQGEIVYLPLVFVYLLGIKRHVNKQLDNISSDAPKMLFFRDSYSKDKENLISEIEDKSSFHLYKKDFTELAIFCFMKDVVKENRISTYQQNQYLVYFLLISLIQVGMLGSGLFDE